MLVTVASGKGGTGKTTVAVNLALSVQASKLLDCDVEEPNAHTLLETEIEESMPVTSPHPVVDADACTLCGKCADFCEFNALFVGKDEVLVYEQMCHSCGGCSMVCPEQAITEVPREVGVLHTCTADGLDLVYGELNIGEPIATRVIKAVKSHQNPDGLNIVDAPPGTACPVIETMEHSDYLILVTEPTPFGLHDLEMAVSVVEKLHIPFGVVINRDGIGNEDVHDFCEKKSIPILLRIPFDRKIAEMYSEGTAFALELDDWDTRFKSMMKTIKEAIDDGQ
ncbi:MAG: ATP-binding protein [Candidatus Thorarchaeota archaeon]